MRSDLPPEQLAAINQAARVLTLNQFAYHVQRYGTVNRFRDGWSYHNATHNLRVAWQSARGAARLVEAGVEPTESVAYALIAGIYHDHVQEIGTYDLSPDRQALAGFDQRQAVLRDQLERRAGARPRALNDALDPNRERLSVDGAHAAMRDYERQQGFRPGQLFTQSGYDTIEGMIMQTQVVTASPEDGIRTRATPDWALGAAIADADKSDLAFEGGTRTAMLLLLERSRSELPVPAYSDGFDVAVPQELLAPYLEGQVKIFANDRFTLDQSNDLFPHRAANLEQLDQLRREVAADRMDWRGVLTVVTEQARSTPVPGRGASTALIADPHDLVPELAAGLRGDAPGVRSAEALPAELRTARDVAGIDLTGAAVLAPGASSGARPPGARNLAGPRSGVARE